MMCAASPSSRELRARQRFEYHIGRLRIGTRLGSPRPHLDVLVSLCEWLVAQAGTGKLVDHYRVELGTAKAAVAWRAARGVVVP
jgi:hypothetical protein